MAAGAVQGLGEGGGGRGFLGPRVPTEVEAMARGVQDVGKETFRRLLKGRARAGGRPVGAEGPRCPSAGTRGVPSTEPLSGAAFPEGAVDPRGKARTAVRELPKQTKEYDERP